MAHNQSSLQKLAEKSHTSFADDAGGTDNLSVRSGVHGLDSSFTIGPEREWARRNVAECGRGGSGGFCNKFWEKVYHLKLIALNSNVYCLIEAAITRKCNELISLSTIVNDQS